VAAWPVGHPFKRVGAHRAAIVHLGRRRRSGAAEVGSAVDGGVSGGGAGRVRVGREEARRFETMKRFGVWCFAHGGPCAQFYSTPTPIGGFTVFL
jgi:hypothetical protein